MEAITVTNLSKTFHSKFAVQALNIHIPEGAIYGMIGETGAGMGVLIENPGVYPGWTARENLMIQALNIGVPNPKQAVKEALDAVRLSSVRRKKQKNFPSA